jgi:hypothetical protein
MLELDRAAILAAVRRLPPEEQRDLAQEILQTAPVPPLPSTAGRREPPPAPDPRLASAVALRGIAKTAVPLDDARLLDESRMERYG